MPASPAPPMAVAGPAEPAPGGVADGVRLVRLGPPDAGELLTVQRAAYVTEAQLHADPNLPPLRETLAQVRADLADPAVTALGLRAGSRLIGGVRLRPGGDRVVELGRLALVPDLQGLGWGSRLLAAALDGVPAGTRQVRLFTGEHSAANLRLYRRHGFVETHRSSAGTHQLVHLVLRLDPPDSPPAGAP